MLRDYRWSMTFVLFLLIAYTAFVLLAKKSAVSAGHEPASTTALIPNAAALTDPGASDSETKSATTH